jgi:hypothetical protein
MKSASQAGDNGWPSDGAAQTGNDGWNNGETQADNGDNGGGGKGMLDERMSEGTNLISNDFQVEVSMIHIIS